MKKIIVDKTEGVAEVIDRILNEPDKDVTLVIPKGSALGKSISNFHLLKREADSAGRTVTIESVDDTILAFARESSLESSHPLWRGVRGSGGVSDIVPRHDVRETTAVTASDDDMQEEEEERPEPKPLRRGQKKIKEEVVEESYDASEEDAPAEVRSWDPDEDDEEEERATNRKVYGWIAAAVIVILLGFFVTTEFFNHATISIDFQKTPWTYQDNFIASASGTTPTTGSNVIPAQVFSTQKNVTELFPGSSVQNVSQKAQGTITIYNNYSAASQDLVATTRFLTPDGKIFRLTTNVTVPGAQVTAGKVTAPSSITAPIVADQAGPDYNVGPVAKLTIPGFQSDAGREAGFYGAIATSTTGGFIGKRAVPTAADIAAAKASTTAILEAALQGGFSGSYPNNIKILDGATNVTVPKLTVNTSTDANGNFSVFGEATLEAIGFDESALKAYLLSLAQTQEQNSVFSTSNLDYGSVTANFAKDQVSFSLSVQATLEPQFSVSTFQGAIAGRSISDARAAIAALPQLSNGTISVWPFWLWKIPSNPNKVHITAD